MDVNKKRLIKHTNKYLIHFNEISIHELDYLMPINALYTMDTESSFKNKNEGVPIKIENKKGKFVKNPDFDFTVHVYAWAVSNTENDFVIYSEKIEDMFKLFDIVGKNRIKGRKIPTTKKGVQSLKSELKFKCFVHNLAWDIEFCKYILHYNGYKYNLSNIDKKSKKKVNSKVTSSSFNIIENENIVYSANVNLGEPIKTEVTIKKGKEIIKYEDEIFTSIDFIDSYKIMAMSLDTIAKNVIKIDDMFYKLSDSYDYEKVREEGHKLTEIERLYLYNDVYILKEFIKQFYLPLGTTQTTASSISFEAFIKSKFEDYTKPYEGFLEHYPDLFEYKNIYGIIKKSYKGGWTQANKKYVGNIIDCNKGISIDINSSYPAVIKNKPLPFGEPLLYQGFKECDENELSILTICFDAFDNKDCDNLIGEIQVGSNNSDIFNCKGTEYIHTNIIEGQPKGTNGYSDDHRYKLSMWNFELYDILKNTNFYTEKKKYCHIRDIFIPSGELKEGYEVESTLVFKSNVGFFANEVDTFTAMKIKGKVEGNAPMTSFAKLVLNSFYGKLASNPVRSERDLIINDKGLAEHISTDINYLAEKKYYPAFSSAVTAWARVNLRNTLYKIGYNNVLYFDTDSLYTTLPIEIIKKKIGDMLHPTELGKWDIEKEYTKFKAIGSKKYMVFGKDYGKKHDYKIHCKCAGLPKEVREEQTFDSFYLGAIFTGKKVKTRVPGGYALIEGEYKLNDNGR